MSRPVKSRATMKIVTRSPIGKKAKKVGTLRVLMPALRALAAEARTNAQRVAASLARGSEDEEAVHDFRVAVRRMRTLLRPSRPLFGREETRALERALGDVARRTGRLRDEEVLRETLLALEIRPKTREALEGWLLQRAKQEQRLRRASAKELAGMPAETTGAVGPPTGLVLALDELAMLLVAPRRDEAPRRFVRRAMGKPAGEGRELAKLPVSRAAAMHELRIRMKRVRYAAEIFRGESPAFAPVVEVCAGLQKKLGVLHDFDEAIVRVERARALPAGVRRALRVALRKGRRAKAKSIAGVLAVEVGKVVELGEVARRSLGAAVLPAR